MTRLGLPGHLTRPSRGEFFPAASGKLLLSLPAAQVPTRISPPRQQANAAEADTAAESADTVPRAATAPVSKPVVFLVEPWTIQPVQTHRQHLLPILPTLPISSALPIPTLRPPCLNQRCFVSVSPHDFSCLACTVRRPPHVRRTICAADSPRRTPSCTHLRCRFSPLLAWLPLPPFLDQQSFSSSPGP
jgi:hypothetical protein